MISPQIIVEYVVGLFSFEEAQSELRTSPRSGLVQTSFNRSDLKLTQLVHHSQLVGTDWNC